MELVPVPSAPLVGQKAGAASRCPPQGCTLPWGVLRNMLIESSLPHTLQGWFLRIILSVLYEVLGLVLFGFVFLVWFSISSHWAGVRRLLKGAKSCQG